MEDAIGPRLLKPRGRGVHSLASSGQGTRSQHLNMLSVTDFGTHVNYFLSGFEKFLGELSKLKNFPFNEWVSQPSYGAVDELLIWLSVFKYPLSERGEQRLGAVMRLGSQLDGEDGMSLPHGEEGSWIRVVQHEPYVLGLATIVISIAYGCRDAEPSV